MNTLFVVVAVIVVVALLVYLFSKGDRREVSEDSEDTTYTSKDVEDTLAKEKAEYFQSLFGTQTPQQGEEEYQQLTQSLSEVPQDSLVDKEGASEQTQASSVEVVREVTVEDLVKALQAKAQNTREDYKPKTLEEKLAFTYYFHSKDFSNAHRYSVAGKFVKVEEKELVDYPSGYKLVLAYAVVGDQDKFSRSKGREIAEANLLDCKKQYEYPVTQEELETPGRTFGTYAKSYVPFTVLSAENRHYVRAQEANRDNWEYPTTPSEEESKAFDEYLAQVKVAPHRLLVAEVEVVKCEFCGSYELGVLDVNLQVEDCQETKEEDTTEAHTEQGL